MPSSLIEVRCRYTHTEEVSIIDAVHHALVSSFAIPESDKHVRLMVHEPHRMATAPDLHSPDRYTLVTVDCFAGRSIQAKRNLYREIVDGLGAAVNIPADHITIILRESAAENWGIRGGQAACDIELGFDVNV
ncbi:MAG: tautomerase family protein [Rhodococcus sp. (in: high G+C Gram-positive bacteria)]